MLNLVPRVHDERSGHIKGQDQFFTLLKEAARGETIVITKRGHSVARLTAPEAPDHETDVAAAKTLRGLRKRIGWATTEDILQMRDAGRRLAPANPFHIQPRKRHR